MTQPPASASSTGAPSAPPPPTSAKRTARKPRAARAEPAGEPVERTQRLHPHHAVPWKCPRCGTRKYLRGNGER